MSATPVFVDSFQNTVERAMSVSVLSRLDKLRIRVRMALPAVRRELEAAVSEELVFAGVVGTVNAAGLIDWENFDPEKFALLVETILKIIQLFMGM